MLRCRGQVPGVAPVELEGVGNCIEIGPDRGKRRHHRDVSVLFIDCEVLPVLHLEKANERNARVAKALIPLLHIEDVRSNHVHFKLAHASPAPTGSRHRTKSARYCASPHGAVSAAASANFSPLQ